jgi:hypothetical protein
MSKVFAIKSIFTVFSESAEYEDAKQDQIDAAISTYIAMLDQHNGTQSCVATRGERSEEVEDDEEDQFYASKKRHSKSLSGRTSSKRCAPDKSLFAWLVNDETDDTVLNTSQELTQKLVQNHALNIKTSKCMVLESKQVSEFPDSEWNNVLAGKAANFDFTGMYSTSTNNRAIENIGDLKLHFGTSKHAKTVETHRDWVIA